MAGKTKQKSERPGGRVNRDLERITVFIDPSVREAMKVIANKEDLTESDIFRRACREFIERNKGK
jgi:hypothetical protein